jgi:hypothetical protein
LLYIFHGTTHYQNSFLHSLLSTPFTPAPAAAHQGSPTPSVDNVQAVAVARPKNPPSSPQIKAPPTLGFDKDGDAPLHTIAFTALVAPAVKAPQSPPVTGLHTAFTASLKPDNTPLHISGGLGTPVPPAPEQAKLAATTHGGELSSNLHAADVTI